MTYWCLDDDHVPRPCGLGEWSGQMEDSEGRRVGWTELHSPAGMTFVSTVFLGIDHGWGSGPPVLFETMVCKLDGEWENQVRYHTWDEAVHGHKVVVAETIAWLAKALVAARG